MGNIRRDVQPSLSPRDGLRPRSPAEALEPGRAPSRPRGVRDRRRQSRVVSGAVKVVSGIMTVVLVLMVTAGGLTLLLYHLHERPGPLEVSRVITIPKGEGRIEIAERLEREGVIQSRWVFVASHLVQSWFGPRKGMDLKAGDYEIKKNASMAEVLDILAEGKAVLYKLTIPEGLTSQQIVERINVETSLTGGVKAIPPEGSLLPDTYRFSKGMDRQELVERMKVEQQRFFDGAWEQRQQGLPVATKAQALILASIVEKETGRPDERDRVAAVFVNRLKKGMRLQSDPTIIYGIAGAQGTLGRPLTRADIDQKTPYNTYQIDNLPPGPICNPGRPAIEATLNPAKTSDLYFVADGSGGHTFSDTLKEHNAAVATWRKVEKEMKAKQELQAKQDPAAGAANAPETPAPPAGEKGAEAIPNPPAEDGASPADPGPTAPATPAAAAAPTGVQASTMPLPLRKPKN
jgi:UPF0755 protein